MTTSNNRDFYDIEYTDTFGDQPNYSWVHRARVSMPTFNDFLKRYDNDMTRANTAYTRVLVRRAKAAVGLTGVRGRTEDHGLDMAFYPAGRNEVLFIIMQC